MVENPVLVVVNDEAISIADMLRSMGVDDNLRLLDQYAQQRLIVQLARESGLEISREDIQHTVNEWRYRHRLECVEDTEGWLMQRGIGLEDVAWDAEARLLETRLRAQVTADQIEPHFVQHRLDFDEADVCWIYVEDEGMAEEIQIQVHEGGINFYGFARRHSQDERTRPAGGYLGRIRRSHLPKGIAPLVFAAEPKTVVGPFKVDRGFALYLVQRHYPAALTEDIQKEIRKQLFKRWIKKEMRKANITFPWLAETEQREIA
ncbi:MAG: peptidylprolyl isomerase [bacterium]|nr:peptidylprolyl isomerase [bacterium]